MTNKKSAARIGGGTKTGSRFRATVAHSGPLLLALAIGIATCSLSVGAQTQTSSAPAEFEVASIKPSGDLAASFAAGKMPHMGMKIDNSQVDIGAFTLTQLISTAYKVKAFQITGPDWMKTTRFDIIAKIPDGASKDQVPEMLRGLLEERFKLTVHRDNKELPAYGLMVGKNGTKLTPSPPDPVEDTSQPPSKNEAVMDTPDGQVRVKSNGRGQNGTMEITGGRNGTVKMSMANGTMHLESSKMSMASLAERLTPFLDHPVVDMTEMKGTYVVSLDLSMEDMMAAARASGMGAAMPGGREGAGTDGVPVASDPAGSSIFSSVQKLGLKLERQKVPFELIVVDHLEKVPTDN
jgi:uncharacterized protein (TIGR03435 family)